MVLRVGWVVYFLTVAVSTLGSSIPGYAGERNEVEILSFEAVGGGILLENIIDTSTDKIQ